MRLDERPLESVFGIRLGSPVAYLVASMIGAGAVLLRISLDPYITSAQFIFYFPAVLLAALLCGSGPGIWTALLCGCGTWYFIIPPRASWAIGDAPHAIALCLYFVLAPAGAAAVAALRHAITRRRLAEEQQRVLVSELQHRTRNLLGIVRGMSHQLLRSSTSMQEFAQRFDHRLSALSRVQSLLSSGDETIDFGELVRMELLAHNAKPDSERIRLIGPHLTLSSRTAQSAALAIHELTTNATKHGALSQDKGRLTIMWTPPEADQGHVAVVEWRESGVELASNGAARGTGFGLQLIEKVLPYDLGTRTSFEFTTDGIHCRLELPLGKR